MLTVCHSLWRSGLEFDRTSRLGTAIVSDMAAHLSLFELGPASSPWARQRNHDKGVTEVTDKGELRLHPKHGIRRLVEVLLEEGG